MGQEKSYTKADLSLKKQFGLFFKATRCGKVWRKAGAEQSRTISQCKERDPNFDIGSVWAGVCTTSSALSFAEDRAQIIDSHLTPSFRVVQPNQGQRQHPQSHLSDVPTTGLFAQFAHVVLHIHKPAYGPVFLTGWIEDGFLASIHPSHCSQDRNKLGDHEE